MTATQFVFQHPYCDMVCNRLADFDYRKYVQWFGLYFPSQVMKKPEGM